MYGEMNSTEPAITIKLLLVDDHELGEARDGVAGLKLLRELNSARCTFVKMATIQVAFSIQIRPFLPFLKGCAVYRCAPGADSRSTG